MYLLFMIYDISIDSRSEFKATSSIIFMNDNLYMSALLGKFLMYTFLYKTNELYMRHFDY